MCWLAQGDLAAALTSFAASHDIFKRLAAADPGNAGWQRDLSVSHERIGGVLVEQGDLAAALKSFAASLAIDERLAAADPGHAGWQRELSVSHNKIGDVLVAQGDLAAALTSFAASHDIFKRLAAADPGHAGWQRDLAFSHWRLARYGDQPRVHWQQVVAILKGLQEQGRLAPVDQKWLPIAEENLAAITQ
jgi:tetratricopeptide (TPR) repeat protein